MKKCILALIEVLLIAGCAVAAGWDWGKPMPQMPTPGMAAPAIQYQPHTSTFGYPSPWYAAPQQSYTRPYDGYYTQPYMYHIYGGYGNYFVRPIR